MATLSLCLLLILVEACQADDTRPEQIHLAYTGTSSERIVNYVTQSTDEGLGTMVAYGTDPDRLSLKAIGDSFVYDIPLWHKDPEISAIYNVSKADPRQFSIHNVKLTGLQPNTKYYYKVGDVNQTMSDTFSFSTKENNIIYAVYGDMGYSNAVSLPQLVQEARDGHFQAVIHVGDLAYDFYQKDADTGDNFMNAIQPVATLVPYMALPGNHEHRFNFSHYKNRFSNMKLGPGATSGSDTSLWYSFNVGLIHFVAFDTEVFNYFSDVGQIQRQLNWLEADLAKANTNRDKRPWIVSLAHKIDFMDETNFTHISPLLHKYGVDIHFCGHSHNYQRHYPYYQDEVDRPDKKNVYVNPKFMTVIVAGSAGSKEKISHGLGPKRHLAKYIFDYGFGHLQVMNHTHLRWTWENTGVELASIEQDELWIVQDNHGMRSHA
ncbi:acid phosphatase type 7 [Nematostella vectensis]|uniref:acid phosphatase type 7 n=1 Tax=Nematostella vectensis TaxID=45351 RepID=UPI00138FBF36|nr:acid phosphatase type 7 [Nematostella vectensis]